MVTRDRRNHAARAEACRLVWNALRSGEGVEERLLSRLRIASPGAAERILKRLALCGLARITPDGWKSAPVTPAQLQQL